ncbi:MAG: cobalamin B12-binding domain-containing protein [Planctomycetota bacterium]
MYRRYLSALIAGDRRRCLQIVGALLESRVDIKGLYIGLFQRSLYEVGDLWERREVSVAVEHLATAITDCALNMVHPILFAREHRGSSAVISCVVNEFHQIGGKIVADYLELHGWNGYFLGANSPVDDLVDFVRKKSPNLVGLSVSLDSHLVPLGQVLDRLAAEYPSLPVLVGGQAFRHGGSDMLSSYPRASYIASLDELDEYLAARQATEGTRV